MIEVPVQAAACPSRPASGAVADRLRAMAADEVAVEFGIVLGAEAERGNNEGSVS